MFVTLEPTASGLAEYADNPRHQAQRYLAWLISVAGVNGRLTAHPDGSYSVAAPGLATLTFHPGEPDTRRYPGKWR